MQTVKYYYYDYYDYYSDRIGGSQLAQGASEIEGGKPINENLVHLCVLLDQDPVGCVFNELRGFIKR